MSDLSTYLKSAASAAFPALGAIVFYSVSESDIPQADFLALAKQYDCPTRYIPRPPADVDVFRVACRDAEVVEQPTDSPDIKLNYLVRRASAESDNPVIRRIVREHADRGGHRLDYEELVDVQFDRTTNRIKIRPLHANTDPVAYQMATSIAGTTAANRGKISSNNVREYLRKTLEGDLQATKVRPSGGIYFVSRAHAELLANMEAMVHQLPGASMLHSLPLLDSTDQRAMLKAAFETETNRELAEIIADYQNNGGDKMSARAKASMLQRQQAAANKVAHYAELLEDTLSTSRNYLSMLNQLTDNSTLGRMLAELNADDDADDTMEAAS